MKRIYACIAIVAVLLSVAFYSSWKVQSFADVISADPVSYTHLTLPTIA